MIRAHGGERETDMIHDDAIYNSLIQSLPDIVYKIDPEGRFTFVSNSICKLGYDPAELIGKHYSAIIHPDSRDAIQREKVLPQYQGKMLPDSKAPKLFDERRTGTRITRSLRIRLLPRDPDTAPAQFDGEVISLGLYEGGNEETGQLLGTIGIIRDLSDVITIEKALRLTERFYRSLIDYSSDAFSIVSTDGTILYVSESVRSFLGYTPIDLIGESLLTYIHPDDEEVFPRILSHEKTKTEGSPFFEYRFLHADWSWRFLESSARTILDERNELVSTVLYTRDVTRRKEVELELQRERERLMRSLEEKNVLLREIHHRVKNNMQIITSLLQLQARATDDRRLAEQFTVCIQRIKSMSLIHERLYQSDNLSSIHFTTYLRSLIADLQRAYASDRPAPTLTSDLDEVVMDIEQAIPCGLIVHEILANAFAHAHPAPNGAAEAIDVLLRAGDDTISLEIGDNGVGMPAGDAARESDTLGTTLIAQLIQQIDGTMSVDTKGGTRYRIAFPRRSPDGNSA